MKITTNSHPCFIFSLFQNDLLSLNFLREYSIPIEIIKMTEVVYLTPLKLCNVLLSRRKQGKF